MLPGYVDSDEQAFKQILGRLETEVGGILQLTANAGKHPLWSLVRMMFPIAESLADLICHNPDGTAMSLQDLLASEFEAVRPGRYADKAATLTIIYRHSLTHHDELRQLTASGKKVGWAISNCGSDKHMKLHPGSKGINIQFDPVAFYQDLIAVCSNGMKRQWGGKVKERYNAWLTLDLDEKKNLGKKLFKIEKASLNEIAKW